MGTWDPSWAVLMGLRVCPWVGLVVLRHAFGRRTGARALLVQVVIMKLLHCHLTLSRQLPVRLLQNRYERESVKECAAAEGEGGEGEPPCLVECKLLCPPTEREPADRAEQDGALGIAQVARLRK